jgi:hypothetical protein
MRVRRTFQTPTSQAANMPPAESTRAVATTSAYALLIELRVELLYI